MLCLAGTSFWEIAVFKRLVYPTSTTPVYNSWSIVLIIEIPNFLSDEDCQTVVDLASKEGLDTSEVQDPETGINIEPTNQETFNNWDYNHDGVIDKVEVRLRILVKDIFSNFLWQDVIAFSFQSHQTTLNPEIWGELNLLLTAGWQYLFCEEVKTCS